MVTERNRSAALLAGVLVLLFGFEACRKDAAPARREVVDARPPCRMKAALESFATFHSDRIAPLGDSGSGLFSGGADPARLRSLAGLMRKTAAVMAEFHSGSKEFDGLVARRTKMFRDMAVSWDKLATDLEAKDMAAFKRDRVALISLRAKDVNLRKRFSALYEACNMASPF